MLGFVKVLEKLTVLAISMALAILSALGKSGNGSFAGSELV